MTPHIFVSFPSRQAKLRDLERKYELQAIRHEELLLEMTALKRQAEKSQSSPASKASIEIQTEIDQAIDRLSPPKASIANGLSTSDRKTLFEGRLSAIDLDFFILSNFLDFFTLSCPSQPKPIRLNTFAFFQPFDNFI